jgi:transcriptional regulator with XRE-family HTH domain
MRKSIHTKEYAILLELLIEKRRKAGITQIQLSKDLSFEQPAISKIERGERRVDLVELKMICERLGLTLTKFVVEYEKKVARLHD